MTDAKGNQATAYSEALVREIKAEMGRRDIPSVNALALLMGVNRAKLNERLNRGRNGKRVELKSSDIFRIAAALDIEAAELVRRAVLAAATQPPSATDAG